MAIPTSTVDTVLDYLISTITTQINDTSVLVVESEPGTYQPDDIVSIGSVVEVDTQVHAFVGSGQAHWLSESYRVFITISVYRGGDNASLVRKRAKALSDAIDTAVRTDPTLGAAVQLAWPSKTVYTAAWVESHLGRTVTVEKEVSVEVEL